MKLVSVRARPNDSCGRFLPTFALAAVLAFVLAFGGALAATQLESNRLDGIQLVQDSDTETDVNEADEVGSEGDENEGGEADESEGDEADEAGETDYPPEVDEEETDESEAGETETGESDENEGDESEGDVELEDAGGEDTDSFTAGEQGQLTMRNLSPNTDYDVEAESDDGESEQVGSGTSNADGTLRTSITIPPDMSTGPATITAKPESPGAKSASTPVKIVSSRINSGLLSFTIGTLVLLLLAGAVIAIVRWKRTRYA